MANIGRGEVFERGLWDGVYVASLCTRHVDIFEEGTRHVLGRRVEGWSLSEVAMVPGLWTSGQREQNDRVF